MGEAKITARDTVNVTNESGDILDLKTKISLLPLAQSAMVSPGWEFDGERVVTYLEAILQESLPNSAIIIGAGAIGVEFATI